MKCAQIFELTASYIGEEKGALDFTELGRRLPPLLGAVVTELTELDKIISSNAEKDVPACGEIYDENDEFPLCDACAVLCALRLGVLLVADENPQLAAFLNTEYVRVRAAAVESVQAERHPITNVYSEI